LNLATTKSITKEKHSANKQQNDASSMAKSNGALQESKVNSCCSSQKRLVNVAGEQVIKLLHAQKASAILLMENPCK
jgi:predicted peroxiredoxin